MRLLIMTLALALGIISTATAVPIAVVSTSPDPAVAGEPVTLDGSSSYDTDPLRSIVSWEWDVNNDGTFDVTGSVVSYVFSSLGEFPVTLRVTSDGTQPLFGNATAVVRVDAPQGIPEPATLALAALGVIALGFTRRRKQ